MGRIRTLDDLRDRCRVDDITGCWIWNGGLNVDGSPGVNVVLPGRTRTTTVRGRRAAMLLATGRDRRSGERVWARIGCTEPRCCNPDHARRGTHEQWGADMAASGRLDTPKYRAAVAKRGQRMRKLTAEQAAAIRNDPRGTVAVSEAFGVPMSTVTRIRLGETYRETLPGASVFSWRPTP